MELIDAGRKTFSSDRRESAKKTPCFAGVVGCARLFQQPASVEADRRERVVRIPPVRARLNGWSGATRCAAEMLMPQVRANAA